MIPLSIGETKYQLQSCSKVCQEIHNLQNVIVKLYPSMPDYDWNYIKDAFKSLQISMDLYFCPEKMLILNQFLESSRNNCIILQQVGEEQNQFSFLSNQGVIEVVAWISSGVYNDLGYICHAIEVSQSIKRLTLRFFIQPNKSKNLKIPSSQIGVGSLCELEQLNLNSYTQGNLKYYLSSICQGLIHPIKQGKLKHLLIESIEKYNESQLEDISRVICYNKNTLIQIELTNKINDTQFQSNPHLPKAIQQLKIFQEPYIINFTQFWKQIKDINNILILRFPKIQVRGTLNYPFRNLQTFEYSGTISKNLAYSMGIQLSRSPQLKHLLLSSSSYYLGLALQLALRFTQSLQTLYVRYGESKLEFTKGLGEGMKFNQSLNEITVEYEQYQLRTKCLVILSQGISNNKKLRKLTVKTKHEEVDMEDFYKFYQYLSKCKQLQSIIMDFELVYQLIQLQPERIYNPLKLLHYLTYTSLEFSDRGFPIIFINQKTMSINLMKGLISHQNSLTFQIKPISKDLQSLSISYGTEIVSHFIFIVSFDKIVAPHLAYVPTRHILDLYY